MKCTFRFISIILGMAIALPAGAQIYQWKDKDGKIHFSDLPPPSQSSTQTKAPKQQPVTVLEPANDEDEGEAGDKTKEGGTEPAADAAPAQEKSPAEQRAEESRKRRAAAEAKEKEEQDAARAAQNCQRARTQYAALNSGQRISRLTETGERKFLNEEELAAETERTREMMEAFCGKD